MESQFLKKFKIFLCCSRIDHLTYIYLDVWKHVPVCFPYVLFYLSDKSQFSIDKVINEDLEFAELFTTSPYRP